MSEPVNNKEDVKPKSVESVAEIPNDEVDESVYKRGQQDKWTRARKGDRRDNSNKRFKKNSGDKKERDHKVT